MCARLAQSAERKALNLVVVVSSPTVGDFNLELYYNYVFLQCAIVKVISILLWPQGLFLNQACTAHIFWPANGVLKIARRSVLANHTSLRCVDLHHTSLR